MWKERNFGEIIISFYRCIFGFAFFLRWKEELCKYDLLMNSSISALKFFHPVIQNLRRYATAVIDATIIITAKNLSPEEI